MDMNKNEIRKEIAELIDSIKQHSDEIGIQKRIPQIELELILSKIKRLYERSIVFNYLNTFEQDAEAGSKLITPAEPAPQPEIKEALKEVLTHEVDSIPPPTPVVPVAPPSSSPASSAGKDIKSLIGLNEKFQFTRELFSNDAALYGSALEKINNTKNKEELKTVLSDLSAKRQWQEDNKTVIAFRSIAERRF